MRGSILPFPQKVFSPLATTVVLRPIENGEYSLDGIHWQSRPVFENLELGKEYTFYQRYAETGETLTIETSVALTVVTHIHQYDAYTCTLCGQRRKLGSIAITTLPDKTVYIAGDDLCVAGGKVTLYFSDGSESVIDLKDRSFNLNSSGIYGASGTLSYDSNQVTLSGTSQQIFSPWVVEFNDNNFVVCNNKLWVVIVVGVAGLIIGAVIGFFSKAILRKNKT